MLVVYGLGVDAVGYYRDGPVGTWAGGAGAHLGLSGPVLPGGLRAVLDGCSPLSGERLVPERPTHRRGGWDLVLAAPKSVSLLGAHAAESVRRAVAAAQAQAVNDTVTWLDTHVGRARRDGSSVASSGVVAARFDHDHSDAGDPHLHSHVVLANLTCTPDGRWSALDASALWVQRRSISAVYGLGLRYHLTRVGIAGPWRLGPDGGFDLDLVPRGAIDATSRRLAAVRAALPLDAETSRATRRAARVLTRADASSTPLAARSGPGGSAPAPPEPHPPGPAALLDPDDPGRVGAGPAPTFAAGPGSAPPTTSAVEAWLLARRSTYSPVDVLAALAATAPEGLPAREAQRWAERFCAGSLRAADGRWTSRGARTADRALLGLVDAGRGAGLGLARPDALAHAVAARPGLDAAVKRCATELVASGHAVDVVASPRRSPGGAGREVFVAQATVLDVARSAWQASGLEVAVVCPAPSARRWQALGCLEPPRPDRPPQVVIVDRADRLSTPQLHAVIDGATRAGSKVVLVEGGTLPPRHRGLSSAFEQLCSTARPAPPLPDAPGGISPFGVGPLAVCGDSEGALARTVGGWAERRGDTVMVGLGPAEVVELNRRARRVLGREQELSGPELTLAGRSFAAGDRVIPLGRPAGRPGAEGRVVAVDRRSHRVVVDWGEGAPELFDHWRGRHLGHAYALTPRGLGLRAGPVVLLGAAHHLGVHARRVVACVEIDPTVPIPPLAHTLQSPGWNRSLEAEGPGRPSRRRAAAPFALVADRDIGLGR